MDQKTCTTLMMFLFGLISTVYAQQTVTGTVTEAQGPLPGVNILVKGTQNGATTDFDGKYTLSNVSEDAIIVFSYIGFLEKEVPIAGQTIINVILQEDAAALDEIIVVGYGTQTKREVTGAISQIKSEDIVQVVTANPTTALQGKLAGVQVESNGGAPGSPANVFVRGVSSLTNSFPLYVVDGTIVDDITFINPKDIKDLQVLKDATSAAIYGSRAANGVIIVTTNHGIQNSAPKVSIDVRGGLNTQARKLDLLNGPEYIRFLNQRLINDGKVGNIPDPGIDTDFQDLTINSGSIQDIGFNIVGGGENSSYYFSSNYYKEEGLLISSDFERINTRLNAKFKFGKFDVQPSVSFAQNEFTENLAFGDQGFTVPILNAFNANNEGGFEVPDTGTYGIAGGNKFAQANLLYDITTLRNVLANINMRYEIIEGLTASINFGLDYRNRYSNSFQPTFDLVSDGTTNPDAQINVNPDNDLTEVRGEILSTNIEPTLNYKKSFKNHNLDILIGGARQEIDDNTLAIYAEGLLTNDITNIASFTDNIINSGGGRFLSRLFSAFGRLNYNFDQKYFFTGIIRRDATSKFPRENDLNVGVFPSFSAGWMISKENFWPEDSFINTAKLRGGFGSLGSQNIPDYVFQPVVDSNSGTSFGGATVPGFAIINVPNADISFETSKTINIGADFTMMDRAISVSIDYFNRDNEDVLLPVVLPSNTGTRNAQIQNAASINNSGFELEASYSSKNESNFQYNIGFNIAAIKNELTTSPNPLLGPGISEEGTTVNQYVEGEPLGFFFGFQNNGVYQNRDEINNDPGIRNESQSRRDDLQPGDFRRVDVNGDGVITDLDKVDLGDPTPDFSYGINFSGTYKNLDFSLFFNGQQGNEIYNVQKFFGFFFADDNKLGIVRDAFTPQNPSNSIPRVSGTDLAGNQLPSDFFVEDGSFFRLKTLEIGYDLTKAVNTKWVSKTRVFFNMQNIFTITNYSGYDPEIGSAPRASDQNGFFGFNQSINPVIGRGLDITAQPRPRTFIVGLQMNF